MAPHTRLLAFVAPRITLPQPQALGVSAQRQLGRAGMELRALGARIMPQSGAVQEIAPLDGLRAFAVLMVVWVHIAGYALFYKMPTGSPALLRAALFGSSGVFLFFVLSGFLLFLPYARAILAGKALPSARRFYWRRALRILPLYYTAVVILVIFERNALLMPGNRHVIILSLLMLHDMTNLSFDALTGPFWSIAVEFQFYMLLPGIAFLLAKLAGKRAGKATLWRLALGMGLLIAFGLATRWVAATVYQNTGHIPVEQPNLSQYLFMALYGVKGKYLDIFALGMAASVFYVAAVERGGLSLKRLRLIGSLALALAVPAILFVENWGNTARAAGHLWIWSPDERWQIFGEWSEGLCFVLLLLGALIGPRVVRGFFSAAPLRFVGLISYSIYIWHYPIIESLIAPALLGHEAAYLRLFIYAMVATIALCAASYYMIERPFIARKRRVAEADQRPASPVPAPVVAEPINAPINAPINVPAPVGASVG